MQSVEDASASLAASQALVGHLAAGAGRLASVLQMTEANLQDAFSEFSLSTDTGEPAKVVSELFVAWREVGEASGVLATRMLGLVAELQKRLAGYESERRQRLAEAARLMAFLEEAERPVQTGWFSWGKVERTEEEAAADEARGAHCTRGLTPGGTSDTDLSFPVLPFMTN